MVTTPPCSRAKVQLEVSGRQRDRYGRGSAAEMALGTDVESKLGCSSLSYSRLWNQDLVLQRQLSYTGVASAAKTLMIKPQEASRRSESP